MDDWMAEAEKADREYHEAKNAGDIEGCHKPYRRRLELLYEHRTEVCEMMTSRGIDPALFLRWLETYSQGLINEHWSLGAQLEADSFLLNQELKREHEKRETDADMHAKYDRIIALRNGPNPPKWTEVIPQVLGVPYEKRYEVRIGKYAKATNNPLKKGHKTGPRKN